MLIRLLIACGMLAVAGTASAQVYHYGHNTPVYDSHVTPYYGSHYYDEHHGHAHSYSHGYRSSHPPLADQYEAFPYDAGSNHQAFGYGDFDSGHGAPVSNFDSCRGASVCPLQSGYAYADSPQQYGQFGDQQYGGGQFRSSLSDNGHVHDGGPAHNHGDGHNHAHDGPASSLAPRSDVGRLQPLPRNEVPFRDQAWPRMRTSPPSDRQPVTPPALPPPSLSRPSQPQQFETPLGDGPPPNTVPLSATQRSPNRNAGPTAVNI